MSTGPTSPDGKNISSRNATTHGCCAEMRVLVGDERQEDFDRLRDEWLSQFPPDEYSPPPSMVEDVIWNHWSLKRVQRRFHTLEQQLVLHDPADWPPALDHKLQLMLRYKTAAERSFQRSLTAVERFRGGRVREWIAVERLVNLILEELRQEEREKQQEKLNPGKSKAPKPAPHRSLCKPWTLRQDISVSLEDGITVTRAYPSTQVLLNQSKVMYPPAEVCRTFEFAAGVLPIEYSWAAPYLEPPDSGRAVQIMSLTQWRKTVAMENNSGTPHLGPENAPDEANNPPNTT